MKVTPKVLFVLICLLVAVSFLVMLLATIGIRIAQAEELAPDWSKPKVLNMCHYGDILWDDYELPYEDMQPFSADIWVWLHGTDPDEDPDMLLRDIEGVGNPPRFTFGLPIDATWVEGWVSGRVFDAYVAKQPVVCKNSWLPLIELNR